MRPVRLLVLALLLVVVGELVLRLTVFGRHALATGANEQAVRFPGVDPRPVRQASFVPAGGLAGLAGRVHAARPGCADPTAGVGCELPTGKAPSTESTARRSSSLGSTGIGRRSIADGERFTAFPRALQLL